MPIASDIRLASSLAQEEMETMESTTSHSDTPLTFDAKPRRSRWWKWLIAALVLLLIGGVSARRFMKPKPDDTKYTKVTRQDIRQTVSATGTISLQTAAEVKLGAEVSGKVRRLYVDVGDSVQTGQLVCELENRESDSILQQSRANVESARARVRQAKASLDQQKPVTASEINRSRSSLRAAEARLRAVQLSARSQPESSQADIRRAEASLAVAQDALTQARATADLQVDSARANLESAQAMAEKAALDANRARQLVYKGYISEQERDAAITTEKTAQADVTARRKALDVEIARTRYDVSAAEHRVEEAQAQLSSAQAASTQVGVRSAEAQAAVADTDSARSDLESALAGDKTISIRQAQYEEAVSGYQQALAEYQRQFQNHQKLRIYSPMNGIVTSVTTKEGETVTAGFQTQTLLTIADLKRIQVDLPVDETDIGRLRTGQSAKVVVDAFRDVALKGRVSRVAADATLDKNVVTYNATVELEPTDLPLKPKMTATVDVDTGTVKNVLVVPLEAVKSSRDDDVVYLKPTDPKNPRAAFKMQVVTTGVADDKHMEIRKGLKEGQEVVLTSTRLERQRQWGR